METPRRSSLDFHEQCKSEELEAKRWMDRASRYLTEGRYESAIQLLQKTENVFPSCKNLPELMAVTQVCYAATWRACHCARPYTRKLPDWYHVLKVDERADFDTIKKRYRQLALLLHPDKNKHVNSEGAFKIITEAYACLSDKEKRDIFNLERRRSFCTACSRKAQLHAAGQHIARPFNVAHTVKTPPQPTPNPSSNTPTASTESDSLQSLRERARARVGNLERDWGGKTTKWMQNLASVRHRYWNLAGSPVAGDASPLGMRPDPTKIPSSPIYATTPKPTALERTFNTFELRRASTSDAQEGNLNKAEETIDVLLRRLRAERSAAARDSPFTREFGVHARTPEAAYLMRPLNVGKARTSATNSKCESGSLYSAWMPKGRCLSKKSPLSPTKVRKSVTVVQMDRVLPRASPEQDMTGVRSSSVRLESLYPSSPMEKDETASSLKDAHSAPPSRASAARSESLRSSSSLARKDDSLGSVTTPVARSSSVRLETLYPSSPATITTHSKAVDSVSRSSSVRVENCRHAGSSLYKEDFTQQWVSRSTARTASGVKTHPEFFDDVFKPMSITAIRTPPYALNTTPPSVNGTNDANYPKVSSRVPNLLSDQTQKRAPHRRNLSSSQRGSSAEQLAARVLNNPSNAAEDNQEERPPLGTRSANQLASYSSKTPGIMKHSKTASTLERDRASSRLEQLEDMERKQKSDAMNGILERLRAEAQTVAATLDRLRENMGAENIITRAERV